MSGKLTRELLEAMDPSALGEIASAMRARAGKIEPEESQFPHRLRFPAGGEARTGQASDALQALSSAPTGRSIARQFIAGVEAETVTLGFNGLFWPRGEPSTVADDFTVKAKPLPAVYPQQVFDAVQLEAAGFTENIKRLVQQLDDLGDTWAAKIKESLDLSKLALDSKGQPFEPYDPSKTAHEQAKAIAEGRMEVPSDAKQLHDLWGQLSHGEKDAIYQRHNDIGNHGGIPFDPTDHRGRDYYNQMHLDKVTREKQQELDQLRQQRPFPPVINPVSPPGNPEEVETKYKERLQDWQAKCDELQHEVNGYKKLEEVLARSQPQPKVDGLPRFLGIVDDKGHGSVSIYNPDYAKDTGTVVPGTTADLTKMGDYDDHAQQMIKSAIRAANDGLQPGQLSVTSWMGYDRPMDIFDPTSDKWAGDSKFALEGGGALSSYQDGIRVSHDDAHTGGPSRNTVIGHSYGSTEVGAAATHGNHLDADSVVILASPGAFAENAHGLSLAEGANVFVGKGDTDPIDVANIAGDLLDTVGLTGPVGLGVSPTEWADTYQIDAGTGDHGSYWEAGNPAMKNVGRILIGGNADVTPRK